MTTTENLGETATRNFVNSMSEALAGVVVDPAIAPAGTPQPTPQPPKPERPNEAPAKPAPVENKAQPANDGRATQPSAEIRNEVAEAPKADEPQIDQWPRTAQDWKKWNEVRESEYQKRDKEIERWKGEATTAQAKIKEIGTPTQHPEYESVKKERDQYNEVLKTIAVENHPRFKEYYDGQVTAQIETAKAVVGSDKSESMARILTLPDGAYRDSQIEELVADMSPLKQAQIGGVLNSLSNIQRERTAEVAKARANFDKLQSDQAHNQKQVRVQLENKFTEYVQKLQSKEGNPNYQLKDKDDAWNKGVNDRVERAKHFLLGNPKSEEIIQAAADAAAYPALVESHLATIKELEGLRAQIKALTTATPTLSGERKAASDNGSPAPTPIPAGSRPMEAAAHWIKGLGPIGQER